MKKIMSRTHYLSADIFFFSIRILLNYFGLFMDFFGPRITFEKKLRIEEWFWFFFYSLA